MGLLFLLVTLKLSLFLMVAFCRETLSRYRWESEVGMEQLFSGDGLGDLGVLSWRAEGSEETFLWPYSL